MHRICVWNTAFLGDAVLTLPLIASLKKGFPDSEIDFWVRPGLEQLFEAQPELSQVLPVAKRGRHRGVGGLLRLVAELRKGVYDLHVCAHTSPRSALAALGSGAPLRVGYYSGLLSQLAFHRLVDRKFRELEEIERLLELLKPLDLPIATRWPRLVLSEGVREEVAAFRAREGLSSVPVLGVHPGSVWATKRWPAQRFGRVAALAAKAGARILIFAGPGEEPLAKMALQAARKASPRAFEACVNMAGRLSLPQLAAHIGLLDCYLCNDSGPMHLAWIQDTPLVALFGPTTRELGFYPRGERSTVIERRLDCRPCGKHGGRRCRLGTHACMRGIEPEEVWQAVRRKLFSSRHEADGHGSRP